MAQIVYWPDLVKMVGKLILYLILLAPWISYSQVRDTCGTHAIPLKKGLYMSFKEYKNNSPSIEEFTIRPSEVRPVFTPGYMGQPIITSNEIPAMVTYTDTSGKVHKTTRFWGYSTGRNAYIKDHLITIRGAISVSEKQIVYRTGEYLPLNNRSMLYCLSDDAELLEMYKKQKGMSRIEKYLHYIKLYNCRHSVTEVIQ